MKKTLLGAGFLALGCLTVASAAPACTAGENLLAQYTSNPTTAPSGTLANGGGPICTVGSLTFTNFSYDLDAGSFTTSIPDVNVETAGPSGGEDLLQFNPNIYAGSDLLLEFQVTGGDSGVDLAAAITGTGFISETICTVFESTGVCPTVNSLGILNISGNGSLAEIVTAGQGGACGVVTTCTTSTAGGIAS